MNRSASSIRKVRKPDQRPAPREFRLIRCLSVETNLRRLQAHVARLVRHPDHVKLRRRLRLATARSQVRWQPSTEPKA